MFRVVCQEGILVLGKEKDWKQRMEEESLREKWFHGLFILCVNLFPPWNTGSRRAALHPPYSRGVPGWYSADSTPDWPDE